MKMEDPCPGYGLDWNSSSKECKSCELIYREYARKCKELVLQTADIPDSSKKEILFKRTHKVNKHRVCKQMLLEGKSREEIINALKPMYVAKGMTEEYAKSRIRSIMYNAEKDINGEK